MQMNKPFLNLHQVCWTRDIYGRNSTFLTDLLKNISTSVWHLPARQVASTAWPSTMGGFFLLVLYLHAEVFAESLWWSKGNKMASPEPLGKCWVASETAAVNCCQTKKALQLKWEHQLPRLSISGDYQDREQGNHKQDKYAYLGGFLVPSLSCTLVFCSRSDLIWTTWKDPSEVLPQGSAGRLSPRQDCLAFPVPSPPEHQQHSTWVRLWYQWFWGWKTEKWNKNVSFQTAPRLLLWFQDFVSKFLPWP